MNDPQFDVGDKPEGPVPNPYEAGFTAEPPPAPRHGCFFYGCIIAAVMAVLALICVGALVYVGYYYYTKMIQEWTSTTPVPIPTVTLSDEDQKALNARVDAFKKALDNGEAAELVLTADDINAWIDQDKDWKGKIFITINGDEVSGKVSLPLDPIGLPGTKGRYFNGSGTFNVSLDDGDLVVIARELEANGKKLPPEAKAQLARENLAKNYANNPDVYKYTRKFESIKVKNGKIYIRAKAKPKHEFDEDKEEGKGDEAKAKAKDGETEKAKPRDEEKPKPKDAEKDEPKEKVDEAPAPKDEPKKDAA